ncbi:MAG TPA: hypothetical protein VNK67_12330 [Burkholderiales bacterium]|nr:hypothetical protein [Burkholderiales bacterium]
MTFYVEGLSGHDQPETRVRRIGEYRSLTEAIAASQRAIDEFLGRQLEPGMTAKELFARYQTAGEHPFIFRDDDKTFNVPGFNHLHYAMTRCAELCGGK